MKIIQLRPQSLFSCQDLFVLRPSETSKSRYINPKYFESNLSLKIVVNASKELYNTFSVIVKSMKNIESVFSVNKYRLKVINSNTRKRCEVCSKLTINRAERRH